MTTDEIYNNDRDEYFQRSNEANNDNIGGKEKHEY